MNSSVLLQSRPQELFNNRKNSSNQLLNINNDYLNIGNENEITDDTDIYHQQQSATDQNKEACVDGAGLVPDKLEVIGNRGSAFKSISRAVLAKKYLVYFEGENAVGVSQHDKKNTSPAENTPKLGPTKVPLRCVNLATRDLMQCKITLKDDRGVSILAAHERLGRTSTEFINPISELIVTPKHFCFVSPATYGNLHSYIYTKTSLKETEAKHLFKQMVSIVNFCHSKGIVLRDLKMGKFVFTDKERTTIKLDSLEDVVILPKADSEDDGLNDRHGCPNYVSPEKTECVMRSGSTYSGKSSDIWALGVSLYAMLAGRYPFVDTDCCRLLHKIRSCSYASIDGISPFAKSLVRCLLIKNPLDRPGCKEVLSHPWFRAFDFQSVPTSNLIRSRDRDESECASKKMKKDDDQVVPGS